VLGFAGYMPYFEVYIPGKNSDQFKKQIGELEGIIHEELEVPEDAKKEWERQCAIAQQLIATSIEEEDLSVVVRIGEGAQAFFRQVTSNYGFVFARPLYLFETHEALMDVFIDSVTGALASKMPDPTLPHELTMTGDHESFLPPGFVISTMENHGMVDGIPKKEAQVRRLYGIAPRRLTSVHQTTIINHPSVRALITLGS